MARFYHKTPQTITELKSKFTWDREERLIYIRNRIRASSYTQKSEVRSRIFERDDYKCCHCGSKEDLTIDHIISVYRGGSNDDSNLQTLCRSCNSGKVN